MADILNGKSAYETIKQTVSNSVKAMKRTPVLAVVQVGRNSASDIYMRSRERDCEECGIQSRTIFMPFDTTQDRLNQVLSELSADIDVDGILLQLPLPRGLSEELTFECIVPWKDVDCVTKENQGLLYRGRHRFAPCTPLGIIALLRENDIDLTGKHCVVIGRSALVGKPLALMLLSADATVTVCHSHTRNLASICKQADVLISAVGRRNFVTADMVKNGAILIDVGTNIDENGHVCGDCTQEAYLKSGLYTPVPGGVGPMTRASLMLNLTKAISNHV